MLSKPKRLNLGVLVELFPEKPGIMAADECNDIRQWDFGSSYLVDVTAGENSVPTGDTLNIHEPDEARLAKFPPRAASVCRSTREHVATSVYTEPDGFVVDLKLVTIDSDDEEEGTQLPKVSQQRLAQDDSEFDGDSGEETEDDSDSLVRSFKCSSSALGIIVKLCFLGETLIVVSQNPLKRVEMVDKAANFLVSGPKSRFPLPEAQSTHLFTNCSTSANMFSQ